MKHKDSSAILDNLLFGTALPDHLARAKATSPVLKAAKYNKQQQAKELAERNAATAKAVAEKIEQSPLVAVCFRHNCACGNSWQGFGYFARRVTEKINGEGDATFTRRINYKPTSEPISATEWQTVKEETCISCFAAVEPPSRDTGRIGQVTMLKELIKTAQV
jgi:hypothetical protein